MYKAVIFDLDNTLYPYDPSHRAGMDAVYKYVADILQINVDVFQKQFEKARSYINTSLSNTAASHNRLLYFQRTLEMHNLPLFPYSLELYNSYWDTFLETMIVFSRAELLLSKLQNHGINVGICSDLTSLIQHRKIAKLGIGNYIDAFVTSEEVGSEKPSLNMFAEICHKLIAEPKDCCFVGDSYDRDILGAVGYGMSAIWFTENVNKPLPKCVKACATYAELEEILL